MKLRWMHAAVIPAALIASTAAYGGDARVVSGGVGSGAREELAQQARGYELKLVFTSEKGAYLADVPVQVTDAKGNVVVDAVSQGPWMFVDLSPGTYTVKATYDGRSETRRVSVATGQKTLQFRWSEPDIVVASDRAR
ncbi:MAG TPA: carboxypeptidase-like regulatory domain-containing protein [Burkholderiales bacterium]|nr:carboxypeptidase-like regulatory domain-containing protein [Burkholderiales bacterium]